MNVFLENKFFDSTKILEADVASAHTKYVFFQDRSNFFLGALLGKNVSWLLPTLTVFAAAAFAHIEHAQLCILSIRCSSFCALLVCLQMLCALLCSNFRVSLSYFCALLISAAAFLGCQKKK